MGVYEDQILPRCVDVVLRGRELARLRARATEGLRGEVVEIGFGSGLNVAYYPPQIDRLWAVDPATVGRRLAARRVAASPVRVDYVGLDGQDLPLGDESVDHVLSTWTLCTIPDPVAALGEVRRVLRPDGVFHFVEHGRCPHPHVARWQDLLTPLQRRVAGGCHLNRPIDRLIADAGLVLSRLEHPHVHGPQAFAYMFEGTATKT
ncbi:MAG: class I SAM-dependent methyltransferase [Acidimicrobiales bacterium]